MSKYLFIGGIKDGEYLDVYDDNIGYWRIWEYDGLNIKTDYSSIDFYIKEPFLKVDLKEYVYIKQFLNGKDGVISVFVYEKVPDVMSTLLNGYRKRKYKSKSKIKIY